MPMSFLVCPRCESKTLEVVFSSPVPGICDVYMCKTCRYTFRSTEPDYMTDPKKYDPTFKLDPKKLDDFPMMPAIPPLRNKQGDRP